MPTALVVNPEPKHMAKRRRRKHSSKGRKVARRRHRRNLVVTNPRRGKGRRRHRRNALVLNPAGAIGGAVGGVMKTAIPAIGGGFLASFIDGKFLGKFGAVGRIVGKVGLAAAVGVIGRRFAPAGSAAAMAGILGTIGGDLGARAAGGLPSIPAQKATKAGLAAMAQEDEQIASLLQGMGIIVQGMGADDGDEIGEGEDGLEGDEMAPGMAAYTDQDPSSYTGYGDMEID